MSKFLRKVLLWIVLIALFLGVVVFINKILEEKRNEKSENNPQQETPKKPNDDKPTDNPDQTPPTDTENWWLTDEEIEHAYQEIRKEIANSPEIQLADPVVVRSIQEGGKIGEDLKKAKIIFFPINDSESHETGDSGNHWTLLVFVGGKVGIFFNYNPLEHSVTPENALKVAKNFHEKAELASLLRVENVKEIPRQTNGSDCGVFVIAYTRTLIKKYQERQVEGWVSISLGEEKDLIFPIAKERQKLKKAGFPKKGTPGKDYDIGGDVEYLEKEEELISQWWPKRDDPFHPLRKNVRFNWNMDIESGPSQLHDHSDNFKEFSKKVRLLSGTSKIEKEKLTQIYRIKKILKCCSLSLEEYKKTKSFNGRDNFQEDKITSEESKFVRENINEETVKEINDLYKIHFPRK